MIYWSLRGKIHYKLRSVILWEHASNTGQGNSLTADIHFHQLHSRPPDMDSLPPPSSPLDHTDFYLKLSSLNSLLSPSPQHQQAFCGNIQVMQASEADRLTAEIHPLSFSPSPTPQSYPQLCNERPAVASLLLWYHLQWIT